MRELQVVRRRVEHIDTDSSGVVHFSRYPALLESAVLVNLEDAGSGLGVLAAQGLDLAITELSVRYSSPARYPDQLDLVVEVDHVGAAWFRMAGQVRREEQKLADGLLTFAVVERATGRATALPAGLSDVLKESRQHADS